MKRKFVKCEICQATSFFAYQCQNCEKFAHVSCAFLQGWEIKVGFKENECEASISMRCCGEGVDLA